VSSLGDPVHAEHEQQGPRADQREPDEIEGRSLSRPAVREQAGSHADDEEPDRQMTKRSQRQDR